MTICLQQSEGFRKTTIADGDKAAAKSARRVPAYCVTTASKIAEVKKELCWKYRQLHFGVFIRRLKRFHRPDFARPMSLALASLSPPAIDFLLFSIDLSNNNFIHRNDHVQFQLPHFISTIPRKNIRDSLGMLRDSRAARCWIIRLVPFFCFKCYFRIDIERRSIAKRETEDR